MTKGAFTDNIDRMFELGLYIDDLAMHDVSRDLILIGIQQPKEFKLALNRVCYCWDAWVCSC